MPTQVLKPKGFIERCDLNNLECDMNLTFVGYNSDTQAVTFQLDDDVAGTSE